LEDKFKHELVTLCHYHLPDLKLLYLFGSHASHQASKNSDIDLAVLNVNALPSIERWEIQQKMAEQLNVDVDLVDLLVASTVLRNQVVHKGICLFDAKNYQSKFEMQTMSMYQRLSDERSDLMKEFVRIEHG